MSASRFIKSASAFIVASALIVASSVLGAAKDVPVALGAPASIPLSAWYIAAPTGHATLGGHRFDLTGGKLLQFATAGGQAYKGFYPNATAVYLLLNTYNTDARYQGAVIGNVVLTFKDGTTQSTNLTVGGNVREWRIGAGWTVNTGSDPATQQVSAGTAQPGMGGGTAVIDMLTIKAATPPKILTSGIVNYTNTDGFLRLDLAGLTVDDAAPTPPAPTPSVCTPKPAGDEHQAG